MGFNYKDVEGVLNEFKEATATETLVVEAVGLASFPIPKTFNFLSVQNLCLGLILRSGVKIYTLVFGLKNPWTGIFFKTPASKLNLHVDDKVNWAKEFSGFVNLGDMLKGRLLEKIEQVKDDRIVKLTFHSGTQGLSQNLIIELFPARPNLIFSDFDRKKSYWKKPIPAKTKEAQKNGPDFESEMGVKAFIENRLNRRVTLVNHQGGGERRGDQDDLPVNEYFYKKYLYEMVNDLNRRIKSTVDDFLEDQIQKQIKIQQAVGKQLKDSILAKEVLQEAEILKSELYTLTGVKHDKSVEKVEKLFTKYKKMMRTLKDSEIRKLAIDEKLLECRRFHNKWMEYRAPKTDDPFEQHAMLVKYLKAELPHEYALLEDQGDLKPKPLNKLQKKYEKSGIRKFVSNEGLSIWVGRNHEENEDLVVRLAKGNDMWFHLKGRPSAHVIVQLPKGKSAPLETMLDAALICAHYSGVHEGEKVDVDYTFKKNVKRMPGGGKKGQGKFLVTYTHNKTLSIKIDASRLQRLMGS